jgi:hypothetical protein
MSNWQHREKKLQKKSRLKTIQKGYQHKDMAGEDSKRLRRQDIQAKIKEREGSIEDVDLEE